jgi:hypothetical protein
LAYKRPFDEVRRELQREEVDLKGALRSLRGNVLKLSEDRQEQRKKPWPHDECA